MKQFLTLILLLATLLHATPIIKVEAQDLLKALAYKESAPYVKLYDWDMGSKEMSPIQWDPNGNNWTPRGFERRGKVYLTNSGKITHSIVDNEDKKPGYWNLYLLGNKDKIIQATLTPNKATLENPSIIIDKAFIQKRVVCQENDTKRVVALKVKFPQRVSMWIEETTNIDTTKGNKSSYVISYDEKSKCLQQASTSKMYKKRVNNNIDNNTKEQIKQFLQSFYKAGENQFPAKALKFYDSKVEQYFERRYLNKEDILADKIRYYKKWPKREYILKDVEVIETYVKDTQRYYIVNTVVDWNVTSAQGQSKTGTSYNIIKLIETDNGFLVRVIKDVGENSSNSKKSNNRGIYNQLLTSKPLLSSNTDNSNSRFAVANFEESGILIQLKYPKYIRSGEYFKIRATMVNNFATAKQGGLTLSFPDFTSARGKILGNNFTSLKGYSYPDKIYNKVIRGTMKTIYFMVECWQNRRWRYGSSKYFEIALKAPYNLKNLRVNIRGILWRRSRHDTVEVPRNSAITDQQGFAVKQINIPIEQ